MLQLAVKHGGVEEYEKVLHIFHTAELHVDKLKALRALCASTDEELLQRTLKMGLSDEVRSQDFFYLYGPVSSTSIGRPLAWQFLQDHWEELMAKLDGTGFIIARVIGDITRGFCSNERAEEVE